jgi:hypothetical protein
MGTIEWFKYFLGAVYEGEPPLCSAPPMHSPGSGDALLRPRPLRAVREGRPSYGSSKPRRLAGRQKCWTAVGAEGAESAAVGVHQAWKGGFVRSAAGRFGDDRVVADRLADGPEPLLPRIGMLWLMVGVQQQGPTQRAAAVLRLEQTQDGATQRGPCAAAPFGPEVGQGRIVDRCRSWHHPVPDDGRPGELGEVAAAATVAEDPPVLPGGVELAEVPGRDPAFRLVRVGVSGPLVGQSPQVVVQRGERSFGDTDPVEGRELAR